MFRLDGALDSFADAADAGRMFIVCIGGGSRKGDAMTVESSPALTSSPSAH